MTYSGSLELPGSGSAVAEGFVYASSYGVVADANYRRRSDGLMFQDAALTIPATDNTTALRSAIDAVLNQSTKKNISADAGGANPIGNYIGSSTLILPIGGVYVASPRNLFDDSRVSRTGVNSGFTIKGFGRLQSVLWVRDTAPGSGDWVFNDDNFGVYWILEDLAIKGSSGAEQIINYTGLNGYGQGFTINRCLLEGNKIMRVTGSAQSDKIRISNSTLSCVGASGGYVMSVNNSQSVGNYLRDCDVYADGSGNTIYRVDYGTIVQMGGTAEVYNGAAMFRVRSASAAGDLNAINLRMDSVKAEIQQGSTLGSVEGGHVQIKNCDLSSLPSNTGNDKIHMIRTGMLHFRDCTIPADLKAAFTTSATGEFLYDWRATIRIDGGFLDPNWHTNVTYWEDEAKTVAFDGDGVGALNVMSGIGRIYVDGARERVKQFADPPTFKGVNGAPYAWHGFTTAAAPVQRIIVKRYWLRDYGLPDVGSGNPTVVLPPNCRVVGVRIVKRAGAVGATATRTWRVVDLDGLVYATQTTTSASEVKMTETAVDQIVTTVNQRTLKVECAAGDFADGHVEILYV